LACGRLTVLIETEAELLFMKRPAFLISLLSLVSPLAASVVVTNSLYNGNSNYAPDGVAAQTTTGYGGDASRANDGIVSQGFANNSTTHSDDTVAGTVAWQVDLLASKTVNEIRLTNRGEGINDRLSNYRVQVLNSSLSEVWGQNFYTSGGGSGDLEVIPVPTGTAGQFVKIQQLGLNSTGNNILSLTEVQVIQNKAALYANLALAGTATQSSTGYSGDASRANDGNTDGFYGSASVTHTDDGVAPGSPVWFNLQLSGVNQINELAIYNRQDCCWGRSGNFKLSILNGGSEVWSQSFPGSSLIASKGILSVHDDAGGFFATGDQIRLELIGGLNALGGNTLSLAELQVFGMAIPEPGLFSMLSGLALLGVVRRRR
jgi:hypothetical protein